MVRTDGGPGPDDDRLRKTVRVDDRDPEPLVERLPDTGHQGTAAADHHPGGGKRRLGPRRGLDERVDHRRHPGDDRGPVPAGEVEVAGEVEPLHDDIGPASPEGGEPPADPDMPHRVDPEIDVICGEPQDFAFGVHGRHPVTVGEHRPFGLPGGPGRVLDLAEIIKPAVGRTEIGGRTEKGLPGLPADRDDVPEGRRPIPDPADEGSPIPVGDDGRCPCIADGVENFILPIDPVRRDGNGPDAPEGEVGDEVLE